MQITVDLNVAEQEALAQFLKRIGWSEWSGNAVDKQEAETMRAACEKLRTALAVEMGFTPR